MPRTAKLIIVTVQRLGQPPQSFVVNSPKQANEAARAIVTGLFLSPIPLSDTAFLLTRGVTRIEWRSAFANTFVTVERG